MVKGPSQPEPPTLADTLRRFLFGWSGRTLMIALWVQAVMILILWIRVSALETAVRYG